MARNYAALPHDYIVEMDCLSDEEFGRLMRALLRYSAGDDVEDISATLVGVERVLWNRVMMQEDRFQDSYTSRSDSSRENGKKGGRPRKTEEPSESEGNPEEPSESEGNLKKPKKPTGFSRFSEKPSVTQKTYTETKTKTETKTETKSITPPTPSQGEAGEFDGMSEALVAAVQDWLAYKAEKRQGYKATGRRNLLAEIRDNAGTYGDAAVIAVIRQSMAANYQGILFARLAERGGKYTQKPRSPASRMTAETYTPPTGEGDLALLEKLIGVD